MDAVYPLPIADGQPTALFDTAAPPGVPPPGCYGPFTHDRRNGLTVTEVLRRYVPAYLAKYPGRLSIDQRRVLKQLLNCRQPALGSHAWHCDWCGHTHVTYNACHNRHCPSCGGGEKADWLDRVLGWSLPTSYLQLIFTQPHELIPLTLANRADLYRLFFASVRLTLTDVGREDYYKNELTLPESLARLADEEDFERWLQPLAATAWQVRRTGPPPYARGPEPALKYLARYVVGSAINDQRLVRDDGRQVTIRIKNYTTDTVETRQLSGKEFVHRFLFHILPRHVARIRYGGLFAGCHRKRKLAICAELLPRTAESLTALPDGSREDDSIVEDFDVLEDSPSDNEPRSAPRCPRCLMPGMTFIGRFDRSETMRLLDDLNWFWRSVVTVIMTLPFTHSGQSRSLLAQPVSLDTLTWTITTDDIDAHYGANNCLPLPDT